MEGDNHDGGLVLGLGNAGHMGVPIREAKGAPKRLCLYVQIISLNTVVSLNESDSNN